MQHASGTGLLSGLFSGSRGYAAGDRTGYIYIYAYIVDSPYPPVLRAGVHQPSAIDERRYGLYEGDGVPSR